MTHEEFFAKFELFAELPDAVAKMRELVVHLAVVGRLLAQSPRKGGSRTQGPGSQPVLDLDDLPFDLPSQWVAARLTDAVREIQTGPFGSSLHKSDYELGGTPVVNPASIRDGRIVPVSSMAVNRPTLERLAAFRLRIGDIVMARRGEMGRCAVVTEDEDGWLCGTGSLVLRMRPSSCSRFLALLLGSPYVRRYLQAAAVGSTMANLNQSILAKMVVALPPLPEQKRIVAKVDELMALCDQLAAQQKERETRHAALARASLSRFAAEPTTANLRLLFHPSYTITPDDLQKVVFRLAVEGKLGTRRPKDEPCGVTFPLLSPAAVDKRGDSSRTGWLHVRLGDLGEWRGGGTPSKSRPDFWTGDLPWVTPKDMKVVDIADAQDHISQSAVEDSSVRLIPDGSLLMVVRGMILARAFPVARTERQVTINQDMKALIPFEPSTRDYLLLVLRASEPEVLAAVERSSHGTCKLKTEFLQDFIIALPPLAEQRRIVEKVDQLMALIELMASQVVGRRTISTRLLDAAFKDFTGTATGRAA